MMNRRKLFGFLAIAPVAVPTIAKAYADIAQMEYDFEALQSRAGGFLVSGGTLYFFADETIEVWT